MFTVKNAVKNIYRYKGKYTLFGILYFLTICVVAVATNIHASMNQITDNLIKEYCGVVRIGVSTAFQKTNICHTETMPTWMT